MLAQNFMTAAELKLTDEHHAALRKALGALERGEAVHMPVLESSLVREPKPLAGFNMYAFYSDAACGTAGCICGWAEYLGGLRPFSLAEARRGNEPLAILFDPPEFGIKIKMETVTASQAATALRSYLTTGEANWKLALSSTHTTTQGD